MERSHVKVLICCVMITVGVEAVEYLAFPRMGRSYDKMLSTSRSKCCPFQTETRLPFLRKPIADCESEKLCCNEDEKRYILSTNLVLVQCPSSSSFEINRIDEMQKRQGRKY